jgi:hypothetical protein
MYLSNYPNRTLCSVLDEMRKCYETRNFAPIAGLIEEAQSMGNRMESALQDKKDIREYTEERSKLMRELKELQEKKKDLGGKESE